MWLADLYIYIRYFSLIGGFYRTFIPYLYIYLSDIMGYMYPPTP